jgi:hypothetical protein
MRCLQRQGSEDPEETMGDEVVIGIDFGSKTDTTLALDACSRCLSGKTLIKNVTQVFLHVEVLIARGRPVLPTGWERTQTGSVVIAASLVGGWSASLFDVA